MAVNHVPVLLKEVIEYLNPQAGQNFADATFGRGGHAQAILERIGSKGRLFVFDVDPKSASLAKRLGSNVSVFQTNFSDIESAIKNAVPDISIHGILFDLGISSAQLSDSSLGLSFQEAGPLNMRLGRDNGMTAAVIVNTWPEQKLAKLIYDFGEERQARLIAKAISIRRRRQPFVLTTDLAEVVSQALARRRAAPTRIHPATKTFQALRMAVNEELENLTLGLNGALRLLTRGGRLAVITFHSLEDRLAKQIFKIAAQNCVCPPLMPRCVCSHSAMARLVNRKPIIPTSHEIAINPRARSAKLRVIEKL